MRTTSEPLAWESFQGNTSEILMLMNNFRKELFRKFCTKTDLPSLEYNFRARLGGIKLNDCNHSVQENHFRIYHLPN